MLPTGPARKARVSGWSPEGEGGVSRLFGPKEGSKSENAHCSYRGGDRGSKLFVPVETGLME